MSTEVGLKEVNEIFKVKVEHKIYSFYTNTIPDYMKIGDTYRQVAIRLNEWKRVYKNLRPNQIFDAHINNEAFFRDLAVHQYLRNDKQKHIVTPEEVDGITAFCTELFGQDVCTEDITEAIDDIKNNYGKADSKYVYYRLEGGGTTDGSVKWTENYPMRPNQEKTVANFIKAVEDGRNNLLMYAVMRFGKSFTAMQCAKAYAKNHDLKLIVITSAKKDVESEWKNTIDSHCDFKEFEFVTDNDLAENYNKIKEVNDNGKVAVVFLTLQVLNKKTPEERHKQVLESDVDLLFIDETHYGARAAKLGKILEYEDSDKDDVDWDKVSADAKKAKDKLCAKINLHLSGTPYNILKTDEFSEKDIIAFCQFSDIADEKKSWQSKYEDGDSTLSGKEAWDNPYFGFPQMIRFAFNLSDESRDYIDAMSEAGMEYFAGLFKTESDDKNNPQYNVFAHEADVLKLFKTIDGSQEGNELLSFLEYEGVKAAQLCRHIVCVLPRCASCDALEKLLKDHSGEFKNLGEYEIINISGLNSPYNGSSYVKKVKAKIAACEKRNKKTISLTVNKMLTGTTVKEWDSMLYFKDTQSAQEYDQATFRIQNPYIEKSVGIKDGKKYELKVDKKPQTLLVDFKPVRMFYMQAYNIDKLAVINHGDENIDFEKKAKNSLTISPIICLNKDKLQKIDEKTIVDTITNYTKDRSVIDETVDMVISEKFLSDENIKTLLSRYPQLDAKTGIKHDPNQDGKKTDINKPEEGETGNETPDNTQSDTRQSGENGQQDDANNLTTLRKQFNACIAKMLFYVFISGEKCSNIMNVVNSLDKNDRNKRIAENFGVKKEDLILLNSFTKGYDKNYITKAIVKMSTLATDKSLTAIERAQTAIKKFNRFSAAEVVTPNRICEDMLNCISIDKLIEIVNSGNKILDIASKSGEFAFAAYNLLHGKVDEEKLKNAIYAIPTSKDAYEFTCYLYENIGLNVSNIAEEFISFDLLEVKKENKEIDYGKIKLLLTQDKPFNEITLQDEVQEGDKKVKFDAIVGNPPYQETISTNDANRSLSKQLFPEFIKLTIKLNPKYSSLITPSRWFTGEAQDGSFISLRKFIKEHNHFVSIYNYSKASNVFDNVWIAGGVNYYVFDRDYSGKVDFYTCNNIEKKKQTRDLFEEGLDIVISSGENYAILQKVRKESFVSLTTITKGRDAFGITGKNAKNVSEANFFDGAYELRCAHEEIRYVKKDIITKNIDIADKWKVFISKGNGGAGTLGDEKQVAILGKPYLGKAKSVCTDSLIPIGCFDTEAEALNLQKYIKTKFLRYIVGILKVSQNVSQNVYQFVPLQDFTDKSDIDWSKSVSEIDQKLYEKYNLSDEEITFIKSKIKPME